MLGLGLDIPDVAVRYDDDGTSGPPVSYTSQIQPIIVSLSNTLTSSVVTINAVDLTKTFIVYLGEQNQTTADNHARTSPKIVFISPTQLTVTRGAGAVGASMVVAFVVISGTSDLIDFVQQGLIVTIASATGSAVITSLDTSRSVVFYNGNTSSTATATAPLRYGVTLAGSTAVSALAASADTSSIAFCAVQFKASVINSIQQFANAYTTANTIDNQTLPIAVTLANCMIAHGGIANNGAGSYGVHLTTPTNAALLRVGTDTTTRTPFYAVIDFIPGVLKNVSRGTLNFTNA